MSATTFRSLWFLRCTGVGESDYDAKFHLSLTPPPSKGPKGPAARVLLTSVFGPYAQDDEYGSRSINPMELYHNQVTREQARSRCGCFTAPGA